MNLFRRKEPDYERFRVLNEFLDSGTGIRWHSKKRLRKLRHFIRDLKHLEEDFENNKEVLDKIRHLEHVYDDLLRFYKEHKNEYFNNLKQELPEVDIKTINQDKKELSQMINNLEDMYTLIGGKKISKKYYREIREWLESLGFYFKYNEEMGNFLILHYREIYDFWQENREFTYLFIQSMNHLIIEEYNEKARHHLIDGFKKLYKSFINKGMKTEDIRQNILPVMKIIRKKEKTIPAEKFEKICELTSELVSMGHDRISQSFEEILDHITKIKSNEEIEDLKSIARPVGGEKNLRDLLPLFDKIGYGKPSEFIGDTCKKIMEEGAQHNLDEFIKNISYQLKDIINEKNYRKIINKVRDLILIYHKYDSYAVPEENKYAYLFARTEGLLTEKSFDLLADKIIEVKDPNFFDIIDKSIEQYKSYIKNDFASFLGRVILAYTIVTKCTKKDLPDSELGKKIIENTDRDLSYQEINRISEDIGELSRSLYPLDFMSHLELIPKFLITDPDRLEYLLKILDRIKENTENKDHRYWLDTVLPNLSGIINKNNYREVLRKSYDVFILLYKNRKNSRHFGTNRTMGAFPYFNHSPSKEGFDSLYDKLTSLKGRQSINSYMEGLNDYLIDFHHFINQENFKEYIELYNILFDEDFDEKNKSEYIRGASVFKGLIYRDGVSIKSIISMLKRLEKRHKDPVSIILNSLYYINDRLTSNNIETYLDILYKVETNTKNSKTALRVLFEDFSKYINENNIEDYADKIIEIEKLCRNLDDEIMNKLFYCRELFDKFGIIIIDSLVIPVIKSQKNTAKEIFAPIEHITKHIDNRKDLEYLSDFSVNINLKSGHSGKLSIIEKSSLFEIPFTLLKERPGQENTKYLAKRLNDVKKYSKHLDDVIKAIKKLRPLFERFGLGIFESLILPLLKGQEVGASKCFESISSIQDSIESEEGIKLLLTIQRYRKLKTNQFYKEILIQGMQENIIQTPLSKEKDIILKFLKESSVDLLNIYEKFREILISDHPDKDKRISSMMKNIDKLWDDIFEGRNERYDEDIFLSLLYTVFNPHITTTKEKYKKSFSEREDRQNDIPSALQNRSKINVRISKGGYKLKEGKEIDYKNWKFIPEIVEEVNNDDTGRYLQAEELGIRLLGSFVNKNIKNHKEWFFREIYRYQKNMNGESLPSFNTEHSTLEKYKEFIGDRIKNDLIIHLIDEASNKRDDEYKELVSKIGKPKNFKGLAKTLFNLLNSGMEKDQKNQKAKSILENNGIIIENIDIEPNGWRDVEEWLNERAGDSIGKTTINNMFIELIGDEESKIKKELDKFLFSESLEGKLGEKFTFMLSKRKPHSVAMYNFGVCIAPDNKLWNDPSFWQMIIFDEKKYACGGIIYRTIEENGKKYLVASIQPNSRILDKVSANNLYEKIIRYSKIMVKKLGYSQLLIPKAKEIHSNRGKIQDIINEKGYPRKSLQKTHTFSYSPNNYTYKEFFIV
ncbi:MAG: hypothetical protein ACQEP1_00530 [Nanobdellota archaeon]